MKDEWTINPLADITNDTKSPMYVQYYAVLLTTITDGKGEVLKRFEGWETNIDVERIKLKNGVSPLAHAVLLDTDGQLIECSAYNLTRGLQVPEDVLLSASQLDLVVYEAQAKPR